MTTPNPLANLTDQQRQLLTTADSLVEIVSPGVRATMPPHLYTTLEDVLRPLCDNPARLDTFMNQITLRDDVTPSALWLGLREQWADEDTIRWNVRMEVQAEGRTPRVAAEAAWDAISHDAPPVVYVWPVGCEPTAATQVDLATPSGPDGNGDGSRGDSPGGDLDYDPTAPVIAQFEDTNLGLFATIRFEIETAGEWVLHWHDGTGRAWTERFTYTDEALVRMALLIAAASSDRPLIDTFTLMTNVRHFLDGQFG